MTFSPHPFFVTTFFRKAAAVCMVDTRTCVFTMRSKQQQQQQQVPVRTTIQRYRTQQCTPSEVIDLSPPWACGQPVRSTRDRTITRTLQSSVSTKSSISHLRQSRGVFLFHKNGTHTTRAFDTHLVCRTNRMSPFLAKLHPTPQTPNKRVQLTLEVHLHLRHEGLL